MKTYKKDTKCFYWEWVPIYEGYVEKVVDDHCSECDSVTGTHTELEGFNFLRYDLKRRKKTSMYDYTKALEQVMRPIVEKDLSSTSFLGKLLNSSNKQVFKLPNAHTGHTSE